MSTDANEQCCTIPAVVTNNYEPKGEYKAFAGYKQVYFIGPTDTGKAIIVNYDVFGFSTTCLQGADILAESTNSLVVVPDFFRGTAIKPEELETPTEEKKRERAEWREKVMKAELHVEGAEKVITELKENGAKKVGMVGYCWGGKLASLVGAKEGALVAVAACHPGFVAVSDAEALKVPIGFFPSQGENKETCDEFMEVMSKKPFAKHNTYKYYANMHHGWAGARAKLHEEENLKEYKDVTQRVANFFNALLE